MDSKPTVLVVDDAASNVQVLAQILKEDYRVKVANSGARALDLAKNLPDLILLDIIMPDMDGYEVCERLKANEETRHIPIIFITARSDAEDEERGLALGAVDYIAKPINSAIVRARVKTHITLQKQYSQLQFLAMHDQLTGLYNRHYLLDYAVKKIANAKRHSLPMSVAMIDIDHFKNLNDSYGHNVGDEVLHATAQVLLRSCRTEDIAARV
ncbi:MAG: diguanylate cyclase, partial [Gammaproteobacteria bacterium]|nr:diguanylate cyclase [Gammaproteobacteria bacterium]